jgi:hypothetical protein
MLIIRLVVLTLTSINAFSVRDKKLVRTVGELVKLSHTILGPIDTRQLLIRKVWHNR